jgi:hypothetical protein
MACFSTSSSGILLKILEYCSCFDITEETGKNEDPGLIPGYNLVVVLHLAWSYYKVLFSFVAMCTERNGERKRTLA